MPQSGNEHPLEPDKSVPQLPAVSDAVRVLGDMLKNEETRFSNLNTRAISLVSATSLVTAVTGFLAKDLITSSLMGWQRGIGSVGLITILVLLVMTAWIAVTHVLNPGRRYLFGANAILENSERLSTAEDVYLIAYTEYKVIYYGLVQRNGEKAKNLDLAYKTFLGAVVIAGLTITTVLFASVAV